MSLFKKLFAKQPGGSIVGNLLRGVGDKFTGGAYSQIFTKPGQKMNAEGAGASLAGLVPSSGKAPKIDDTTAGKTSFFDKVKANPIPWAAAAAGVIALVWFLMRPKGKKPAYRR